LARPAMAVLMVILLGATTQYVLLGYFIATAGVLLLFRLFDVPWEGGSRPMKPFQQDRSLTKSIWRYAIPLIPLSLVGWVIGLGDRYIIGGLLGIGEVGIYAACASLVSMPFSLISNSISQALRPPYFNAIVSGDKQLEKKVLRAWLVVTISVSVLGATSVLFLRNLIAEIFLAEEYRKGAVLMPWLAAGIGLQIFSQVYENVLLGFKGTKFVLLAHSIGAVVCVVSILVLTSHFGLIGAAIASPVYFSCITITMVVLTKVVRKA